MKSLEKVRAAERELEAASDELERAVHETYPIGSHVRCNIAGREKIYPVKEHSGLVLILQAERSTLSRHYKTVEPADD